MIPAKDKMLWTIDVPYVRVVVCRTSALWRSSSRVFARFLRQRIFWQPVRYGGGTVGVVLVWVWGWALALACRRHYHQTP